MSMESGGDNRMRNMSGSYRSISKYNSKDEYIGGYGIFTR